MDPASALLYVSTERVLYRGPLGKPRTRKLAAVAWYVPIEGALSVTAPGAQACSGSQAVCVSAGTPHEVHTDSGHILCFLVESEFADASGAVGLPLSVHGLTPLEQASLSALDASQLSAWRQEGRCIDAELDRLALGKVLSRREIDDRIADVVQRVRLDPALSWQATDAATHCGLSPSRFMHLFKAELGMGWRDFRAWTRARALLACVHTGENLTQLALSLGYPDGTHFSHAIRQITGLRPSDIISGSRHLSVWNESGLTPA
ncbi:helix-turn-helix domain-containing protein [Aquabacterium parvum]|jgi:AraC-like DNA-binding protein|uniref:helix-turn-helix domain-containing protein n=1 Tax=Aquabacterium parvum TaxID=70584 RepID=UPI000718E642|nr:AraC family transcriptional regulator [Aquabacterium parvum]MBU0917489.1 AraC family transcriptional regulator [Gammaproteobacteria bacterium]